MSASLRFVSSAAALLLSVGAANALPIAWNGGAAGDFNSTTAWMDVTGGGWVPLGRAPDGTDDAKIQGWTAATVTVSTPAVSKSFALEDGTKLTVNADGTFGHLYNEGVNTVLTVNAGTANFQNIYTSNPGLTVNVNGGNLTFWNFFGGASKAINIDLTQGSVNANGFNTDVNPVTLDVGAGTDTHNTVTVVDGNGNDSWSPVRNLSILGDPAGWNDGQVIPLILTGNYWGALSATGSDPTATVVGSFGGGVDYTVFRSDHPTLGSLAGGGSGIFLVANVVPEPAGLTLLALAGVSLLRRRV